MHTLKTRIPTPDEQRFIARQTKPEFASYGCLIVACIGPAWLLGMFGYWLGGLISPDAALYGRWVGWAIVAILFLAMVISFIPYDRRQRQRAYLDVEAQIIQDIHVINPRVIEIHCVSDNEPILVFQIASDKILYLHGQWLHNEDLYGIVGELKNDCDEGEGFINGLPPPYSFPCTEFTITRFPNSGGVTAIRVLGEYIKPEKSVDALKPEYDFGDSALLDGSIDDIANVLAHEHERSKSA